MKNAKCKMKSEPPGANGEAGTGEEFNIIPTEFVFFKASPDESTVEVVFSFLAGTASPWAGYGQGWVTVQNVQDGFPRGPRSRNQGPLRAPPSVQN